jgi:hypothetical protein
VDKEVPRNSNPKKIPSRSTLDYNIKNDERIGNQSIDSQIGTIRFIAHHTRPDILAATGILGSHVANPHDVHKKALRHLSCFLKGTPEVGLTVGGDQEILAFGFSDAAYIRVLDSKSRLAYCFFLNLNSGTICARSVKDTIVSHSSIEAEMKALDLAIKQAIWLRGFLKELDFEQIKPTIIFVDNSAAKYLAEAMDNSDNVAHMIVRLNFIQQEVLNKTVEIKYINTEN